MSLPTESPLPPSQLEQQRLETRVNTPALVATVFRRVPARAASFVVLLWVLGTAWAQLCGTPGKDGPGTNLSGVLNSYYPNPGGSVTVPVGATSIPIDTARMRGAAVPITAGDLLLVIQIQNSLINTSNTGTYGDGVAGDPGSGATSYGSAGFYEYVVATASPSGGSVAVSGANGGGTLYAYTASAATATEGRKSYQVVRAPQYSSATITGTVTAPPWDGSSGGVVALEVAGGLSFAAGATIDVSGRGFRGGGGRQLAGGAGGSNSDYRLATNLFHGSKGEGVAGTPRYVHDAVSNAVVDTGVEGYPGGSTARGAPGNAGGGATDGRPAANDENAGGGGGGNGGAGGGGGKTWNSNLDRGGFGGVAFAASPGRLVPGGGGGAGSSNNSAGALSSGGAGGGMVLVRAATVTGSGAINANGANGRTPLNDGGGGGGAGGSVLVYAAQGGLNSVSVSARGGDGGNAHVGGVPHGPGAGGGGGFVALSSPAGVVTLGGGAAGYTVSAGNRFGATDGANGVVVTNVTAALLAGTKPGATCSDLSLGKMVDKLYPVPQVGTTTPILYSVKLSNAGPREATGVAMTDVFSTLPPGVTMDAANVNVTGGDGSETCAVSGVTITCTLGKLAVGVPETVRIPLSIPYQRDLFGVTLSNTAQVSAADQPDLNSTPNNNVATEDDQASLAVTISGLKLSKSVCKLTSPSACDAAASFSDTAAQALSVSPGEVLVYRVDYKLFGPQISDAVLFDPVPSYTTLQRDVYPNASEVRLVCPNGTVVYLEAGLSEVRVDFKNAAVAASCSLASPGVLAPNAAGELRFRVGVK